MVASSKTESHFGPSTIINTINTINKNMMLLSLLLCLSLTSAVDGLMFQSHAVSSQWDTWAFAENGTFYAYYLITEHSPGEGFGVATSSDGQHWTDHGYVWHGPSWTNHHWWEGTGSVWRAPDFNRTGRYIINYSQCPKGGLQNITFAESFDLIHWSQPSPYNSTYFDIDTRYYKLPGRWDCIYSIPEPDAAAGNLRDGYPRYGFWTATPVNGTMGFGMTMDGITWQALPSPEMNPIIGAEVGAVEYFKLPSGEIKYFAILGSGGKMVAYSADSPKGPYTAAKENYEVLAGSCYFARFFRYEDLVLVTHQAYSHQGHTYIAPYKVADVDENNVLRFMYWKANEGFKGTKLAITPNSTSPYFSGDFNISKGMVVESSVVLATGSSQGFVLEHQDGKATVVSVTINGTCTITEFAAPNSTTPLSTSTWDRDLSISSGTSVAIRLLYRRDMVELYVDDYLLPVYLVGGTTTGRFGVIGDREQYYNLTVWEMSLPGTAVWPEPTPTPSPVPPVPPPPGDIAVKGIASCDGYFQHDPKYVCGHGNDGDFQTRWSSAEPYDGSARWLDIDMGKTTTIGSIRLTWEEAWAKGYEIQVSTEASPTQWTTAYNTTMGKGGVETISNISLSTRHIRIFCYERFPGSAWGFSLWEVELFSIPMPPVINNQQ